LEGSVVSQAAYFGGGAVVIMRQVKAAKGRPTATAAKVEGCPPGSGKKPAGSDECDRRSYSDPSEPA